MQTLCINLTHRFSVCGGRKDRLFCFYVGDDGNVYGTTCYGGPVRIESLSPDGLDAEKDRLLSLGYELVGETVTFPRVDFSYGRLPPIQIDIPSQKQIAAKMIGDAVREAGMTPEQAMRTEMVKELIPRWLSGDITREKFVELVRKVVRFQQILSQ